MGDYNFHERKADAEKYNPQWDLFWGKKFPEYKITRGFVKEADMLGLDVKLEKPNNERMLVDEKVSYWKDSNLPVETMSNCELRKLGWAYTNKDYVALVHVCNARFVDEPVLFKCDSVKFKTRIINNPLFTSFTATTQDLYTTAGKAVTREWLENFENDAWFDRKTGKDKQTKLWYY
jgi:hypothetical protein